MCEKTQQLLGVQRDTHIWYQHVMLRAEFLRVGYELTVDGEWLVTQDVWFCKNAKELKPYIARMNLTSWSKDVIGLRCVGWRRLNVKILSI
jgi:hypothetical protein